MVLAAPESHAASRLRARFGRKPFSLLVPLVCTQHPPGDAMLDTP